MRRRGQGSSKLSSQDRASSACIEQQGRHPPPAPEAASPPAKKGSAAKNQVNLLDILGYETYIPSPPPLLPFPPTHHSQCSSTSSLLFSSSPPFLPSPPPLSHCALSPQPPSHPPRGQATPGRRRVGINCLVALEREAWLNELDNYLGNQVGTIFQIQGYETMSLGYPDFRLIRKGKNLYIEYERFVHIPEASKASGGQLAVPTSVAAAPSAAAQAL